jgi:hypothetical protein
LGWVGVHPLAIGQEQVLADLAPRAKVVQTVVCSTFTRGAKPATRRVADGERMNPQGKGGAFAPIPGDDEHQGDEDLENSPAHPGLPPRALLRMAPVAPLLTPTVLRGRGRIFPAPARGNPAPLRSSCN